MNVAADDDHVAANGVHCSIRRVEELRIQAGSALPVPALWLEVDVVARLPEGDPPPHGWVSPDRSGHEGPVIGWLRRDPSVIPASVRPRGKTVDQEDRLDSMGPRLLHGQVNAVRPRIGRIVRGGRVGRPARSYLHPGKSTYPDPCPQCS